MICLFIPSTVDAHSEQSKFLTWKEKVQHNKHLEDENYFSILIETDKLIYQRFLEVGYEIPIRSASDKEISIDRSIGRTWRKYLKDQSLITRNMCTTRPLLPKDYFHGATVQVYSKELYPDFIHFVDTVWLPTKAKPYFQDRLGIKAIIALEKVLTNIKEK